MPTTNLFSLNPPTLAITLFRLIRIAMTSTTEATETPDSVPEPDAPFKPNRCFYIAKHGGTTLDIKIYDITSAVSLADYATAGEKDTLKEWNAAANTAGRAAAKDMAEPWLQVQRNRWFGRKFVASMPSSDSRTEVAKWTGGAASAAKNAIDFPSGSTHCDHDVTMATDSYFKMRDSFVVDSQPFVWAVVNGWSMRQFQLTRKLGGAMGMVARLWQPHFQMRQGGVLVVDDGELDALVAIMTSLVMLRKQRQKELEYGL
jgi:hypothetical protein